MVSTCSLKDPNPMRVSAFLCFLWRNWSHGGHSLSHLCRDGIDLLPQGSQSHESLCVLLCFCFFCVTGCGLLFLSHFLQSFGELFEISLDFKCCPNFLDNCLHVISEFCVCHFCLYILISKEKI